MGYLVKLQCPDCGYEKMFQLGSGRKDYEPKRIYEHFETMEMWNVKVAEVEKESEFMTFRYRLGRCLDCGCIKEVPEVIFSDGSTFYSKKCECDEGGEHEVEWLPDEAGDKIKCPECGKMLELQECGLWD